MIPTAGPPSPQPTRLLIQAKPGQDLRHLHARHGKRVLKHFSDLELDVVEASCPDELCSLARKYLACHEVELVEPDYLVQAERTPNDPGYVNGSLWALHNIGQRGGTPGADLHAANAWDGLHLAGNVIVAVLDTGVRYTHEDLAANIWTNSHEVPGNHMDDDGNGYVDDVHGINAITGSGDPMDDNGHGTHIAGVIGAVGNNGCGVTGVAWRVQILPCKFMDAGGAGAYSDAIECIEYARKAGATIINISWGGPNYSSSLQRAIANARAAGIIFVAAAGNTASNNDLAPFYPASFGFDNVVSVAATNRRDQFASDFSNYGATTVQVAAPGTDIYSTWATADDAYASLSGSSMAAPYVSGALALMQVRFPGETYQQRVRRLIGSCDPLPSLTGKCVSGGRINLCSALALPTANGPAAAPQLAVMSSASTWPLRLRLIGEPGGHYAIEVSNGFALWTPVQTNTVWSDGTAYFTAPGIRVCAQHFFRARLLEPRVAAPLR